MAPPKQLICPQCGTVLGDASYRRFPPRLAVTSFAGLPVVPESVGLLLLQARGRAAEGDEHARDQVEWLRGVAELVYDLRCRHGHSTLITLPQLRRSVARAIGQWVSLRP